jgi:CBS domain-containing protein
VVHPEADLRAVHELLLAGSWPLLPVVERGTLVGVVDADNIAEYLAVNGLLRTGQA